jgi:hypothetical protein
MTTFMAISIGQIGKGQFGSKILSKLKNLEVDIKWIAGSEDKWWSNEKVDWVIVATPNEFHYEQSKYFLSKGVNVFCEKPAAFNTTAVEKLYDIADKNKCKFYVDDVLFYEDVQETDYFLYRKWGSKFSNIIDRIAYHHFYLIAENVKYKLDYKLSLFKNEPLVKQFTLTFGSKDYKFDYNFDWFKQKEHNVRSTNHRDALETMLNAVITGKADFEDNRKRTVFATGLSQQLKEKLYGKIAIIGAGIYGITAALKLANKGFIVDLFETKKEILSATSAINQYRVHRGYHYPRSKETIISCRNNEKEFKRYYARAIIDNVEHYYAIASKDSFTTAKEYLHILDECKLEWLMVDPLPGCDLTVKVKESLFCPKALKLICEERVYSCSVNVFLNHKVENIDDLKGYNYTIVATYSSLNDFDDNKKNYQYELCEKPLFKLPDEYSNKSIVIMDGPFMCFDPYSTTNLHVGGNVVHAIHNRNIGIDAEIPPSYKNLLNKGVIKNPKYTNVPRFIESAKKFFPDIDKVEHIGSMFTVRTVLPNMDKTDGRPTLVRFENNKIYLFSGKIGNCVKAAEEIVTNIY